MMNFGIGFQISPFWAIPLLFISLWLVFRLYNRPVKNQIPKFWYYALLSLRTFALLLIIFLLLKPLFEQVFRTIEKPYVPVFIDNSASMKMHFSDNQPDNEIDAWMNTLKQVENIEFGFFPFAKDVSVETALNYEQKFSNLSSVFPYLSYLSGKNMVAAVIVSDGNHNFGSEPVYLAENLNVPLINLAVGSENEVPDIGIENIFYNQTIFWQTTATMKISVVARNLVNKSAKIKVKKDGRVIQQFTFAVNAKLYTWEKEIELEFNELGLQLIDFEIEVLEGEINKLNNYQRIAVKVVDKKTNWLILGSTAHPDMSAVHSILSENLNFTVESGLVSNYQKKKLPDAIVLHQLPDNSAAWKKLSADINFKSIPKLVIIGSRTWFQGLNDQNWGVEAKLLSRQLDFSTAMPDKNQHWLTLSTAFMDIVQNRAPLSTQYAEYKFPLGGDILFKRMYKGIETSEALMYFVPLTKTIFLNATGLWKWSMEDYKINGSKANFQEFINQVASLLLKQSQTTELLEYKLIVTEGEASVFQFFAPDSLKLKSAPKISLQNKVYNFVSLAPNIYQTKILADSAGLKNFVFEAVYENAEKYREEGAYFVEENLLESKSTAANIQLLKQMAYRSGGSVIEWTNRTALLDSIMQKKKLQSVIKTSHRVDDVIHFKGLFFVLLILFSAEWLIRKYYGLD